ncbi:hypothetical protein F7Q99_30905 [Streptomyces kaniharaensis]|uniref:Uncharacterized protein n=1 Tax=Streptomyces kaniharaensis TaxID=212423 RepID=A0A6N7KXS5_9ACTN|nr:hypothetical protein [Streptomyces kaniharaensis]MQS16486.1 hypothetical protein [Streptomyces kaniharaensis]
MDITPRPNFARVARERSAEQAMIAQAARQGLVPPDIAAAMAAPSASDQLLYQGFEVVTDLASLTGPAMGEIAVPAHLVDGELPARVNVANRWQLLLLYRRLLARGSAAEQAAVLNRALLRELWSEQLAPSLVMRVWEGRFPELARQEGAR